MVQAGNLTIVIAAITSFSTILPFVEGIIASPAKKGIEIKVCTDRDCLTDGAQTTQEMIEGLARSGTKSVTVSKCKCLGPCGNGPNVDLRIDGIRTKDTRPSKGGSSIFRQVNSAEDVAALFEAANIQISESSIEKASATYKVQSTRSFWDFDRTTRIALQRLIYATTALTMKDAVDTGTFDMINGVEYHNSYNAIASIIFIASQFMGTGSAANSVDGPTGGGDRVRFVRQIIDKLFEKSSVKRK